MGINHLVILSVMVVGILMGGSAVSAVECGSIPTDGCEVTQSTTFDFGTYNLPNGISIGADNIELDCNGATLIGVIDYVEWDNYLDGNWGVNATGRNNVAIKSCAIKKYDGGIYFSNTNNSSILSNNFSQYNQNTWDNTTWISGILLSGSNNNVIDRNNILSVEYGKGINLWPNPSNNNVISNNMILNTWREGIWIGDGYATWYNNSIINNYIKPSKFPHPHGSIILWGAVNTDISGNEFWGLNIWGSNLTRISNNNISGNNKEVSGSGVTFEDVSKMSIVNNSFHYPRDDIYYGQPAIESSSGFTKDIYISGNIITVKHFGIVTTAERAENILISNNIIQNSQGGIQIYGYNITVHNNTLSNIGTWIGIEAHGFDERYFSEGTNVISSNIIQKVNGPGIQLSHANGTLISNNFISNTSIGINSDFGFDVEIANNNIEDNDIGIHARRYGVNNVFIYNNLINNSIQAIDEGVNNRWDDGAKGNFWTDWTTPDNNKDGIVDVPRPIDGSAGSYDNYPLTGEIITEINTPSGEDVTVTFEDNSSVEFDNVTSEGTTSLTYLGKVGNKTSTFYKIDVNNVYDISTTAEYSGSITIAIHYNSSGTFTLRPNQNESEDVRLFHYDPSLDEWFDVTSSVDIVNDIVYATVDHLSIYGVGILRSVEELPVIIISLKLDTGIEQSLLAKVESALAAKDKGNNIAAANKLQAFIHEVEALRGKKITGEDAENLMAIAI